MQAMRRASAARTFTVIWECHSAESRAYHITALAHHGDGGQRAWTGMRTRMGTRARTDVEREQMGAARLWASPSGFE